MSSSIRKIIKCVIAFSFIFTVVGCGSSKERTNKETAEVIKNDKELQSEVSLFTSEPYSCISIKGDEYHKKGIFFYNEDGSYTFRKNYKDYDFTKEVKKKNKKLDEQCLEFLDKYDLTKDEVKNYLKYIYNQKQKEFNKLSDKDKILTANKDQKAEYSDFLKDKSDKEITSILQFMKNDMGRYKYDFDEFCNYYYLKYNCPENFYDLYHKLWQELYHDTGIVATYEKYSEDNGKKAVSFNFEGTYCDGYYGFSQDNNGKITYAMIINKIKNTSGLTDESYKLSAHLVSAVTGKDIDECENVVKMSYNVAYPLDGYTCTLTIMSSSEIGFVMTQN